MIAVLNQLPISHVCFGNHEADIQLDSVVERTCEFAGCWLNSNMPSFPLPATGDQPSSVRPFDLIDCETAAGQPIRVGLIGLLTSESGVFRKNRFRGLEIEDTLEAAARWSGLLRSQHGADVIVALTHQSLAVDERLAASGHVDLVLGGHEHEVIERWSESGVPVIKSGSDAQTAAVVDLHLERLPSSTEARHRSKSRVAVDVDVHFEDVSSYEPETQLAAAVNAQLHVLRALEEEVVCSVADLGDAAEHFGEFTSAGTRFQQTSVGAALTAACKEVLQVDVALINGGSIKGNRAYPRGELSYLDLKSELPFPTKMVVMHMPGSVLQASLSHSRAGDPALERRGYLQVDAGVHVDETDGAGHTILSVDGKPFDPAADYVVALPRNLLKGIFNITPLVEFAEQRPHGLGSEDDYVPALNLVLMHKSNQIWRSLGSFEQLDLDQDGVLSREEITIGLRARLGIEPSSVMIDNVIRAIDSDASDSISRAEYERLGSAPLRPACL